MTAAKKPTLAFRPEFLRVVTESDLDDFVSLLFGHDYHSAQIEEWDMGGGQSRFYHVEPSSPDLQWVWDHIQRHGEMPAVGVGVLLHELCTRGWIEEGYYLVSI